METIATTRVEAIANKLEAIATRVEAIASRLEAIASGVEAIASKLEAIATRVEAITSSAFHSSVVSFKGRITGRLVPLQVQSRVASRHADLPQIRPNGHGSPPETLRWKNTLYETVVFLLVCLSFFLSAFRPFMAFLWLFFMCFCLSEWKDWWIETQDEAKPTAHCACDGFKGANSKPATLLT